MRRSTTSTPSSPRPSPSPTASARSSATSAPPPPTRDLDRITEAPGSDNDLVDLTRLQPKLAKIAVGPVRRNGERRRGALPESSAALRDSLSQLAFFRAYSPELTGWFDDFGHSGAIDAYDGGPESDREAAAYDYLAQRIEAAIEEGNPVELDLLAVIAYDMGWYDLNTTATDALAAL